MTTVEKLFVQIFERKNSIIDQVKQHTDFYSQHLASKLLIDGITPPPWLWNPSQSSNLKDLNKDELISEILLPRAWPSTYYPDSRYSICNRSVVRCDNRELSDGEFVETYANAGEGARSGAFYRDNNNEDVLDSIAELDVQVELPQDRTDTGTESNLGAPDRSLAKIQRSKSRQKALELRNSTNTKAKSQSSNKHKCEVASIGIDFSACVSEQVIESNELPGPSMLVSGSHGLPAERNSPKQETLVDNYSGRVASSRSCSIKKNLTSDYCKAASCPDIAEHGMSSQRTRLAVSSTGKYMPMLPFEQENLVNKSQEMPEPCVSGTKVYEVRESSEGDHQNLEKRVDAHTSGVTRSGSSIKLQNYVSDSFGLNIYSDIAKTSIGAQEHSIDLLNQSVKVVNASDNSAESHDRCNAAVSGCNSRQEKKTSTSSGKLTGSLSSTQKCSIPSETPQVDASTLSAKVNNNTVVAQENMEKLVDETKNLELVQPSIESDNRSSNLDCQEIVTDVAKISSTARAGGPGTKSTALQNSSYEYQDIQNSSHENIILTGPGKCEADSQLGNAEADSQKSRIPLSVHSETNRRIGSECLVAKVASDMLMKPKQLDFDSMEECNLNGYPHCTSGDENMDLAIKETGCTPLDCFSMKNKVPCSSHIIFSEKESTLEEGSYSTLNGLSSCPVEFTLQEPSRSKAYSSCVKLQTSESRLDDPDAHYSENSTIPPEEDNMLYDGYDNSDANHHQTKLSPRERSNSLIDTHVEMGASEIKRRDEGIATSCSSKGNKSAGDYQKCVAKEVANEDPTTSSSTARRENCIQGAKCDDENLSLLESNEIQIAVDSSLLDKKFRCAEVDSWPQVKRRKLEDQQTNCFSASRNSQMPNLCYVKMAPGRIDLQNIEEKSKSVSKEASFGDNSTGELYPNMDGGDNITGELCPNMDCDVEGLGLSLAASHDYLVEEIGRGDPCGSTLVEEKESEVPGGPNFDTCRYSSEEDFRSPHKLEKDFGLVHNDSISCTKSIVLNSNSHVVEDCLFPHPSHLSSHDEVESSGIDDTLPVFEGFVIDTPEADDELDNAGVRIDFEALDLPRTTIERASVLEQICRSASMQEPLSHLSSALESHRSSTLHQSLTKGLLEHMDLRSTSFFSEDNDKQYEVSSSYAEEVSDAVQGISYPDCLGYSGAKFLWKSGSPYASPVGKLWERSSSRSCSSEKQPSSNPELTCFPIEEDATISEENENADELADEVQDDINSLQGNSHIKRQQPLFDITESCLNHPASVSAAEDVQVDGIKDPAKSDVGFSGTNIKSKRKLPSHCRKLSVGKENQAPLISANGNKKEKQSRAGSRKPNLSITTSLRRNEHKLSEKGYNRHNNIVSNVTSFIPLVQQKQAATMNAGKKDIKKVKALEAAEAAKRLEEKKEMERKKRKEAVKLERARLEQENLRQLELNKQKKEEERKKKDAEVLARKRMRAEEEKNEKEKKRKRIEEVRRQHNAQEEKLRAKKTEIEKKCSATDEKATSVKENEDKLNVYHMEKETKDNKASSKPESEPRGDEILKNVASGATTSHETIDNSVDYSQHEKVIHANLDKLGKDRNFTSKESQLKSYEISPYKCSDDEDEDDDEEDQPKKFIPSWTSKSCVALILPLQQEIDPERIFPKESFRSTDEVLLHRKVQQKQ